MQAQLAKVQPSAHELHVAGTRNDLLRARREVRAVSNRRWRAERLGAGDFEGLKRLCGNAERAVLRLHAFDTRINVDRN